VSPEITGRGSGGSVGAGVVTGSVAVVVVGGGDGGLETGTTIVSSGPTSAATVAGAGDAAGAGGGEVAGAAVAGSMTDAGDTPASVVVGAAVMATVGVVVAAVAGCRTGRRRLAVSPARAVRKSCTPNPPMITSAETSPERASSRVRRDPSLRATFVVGASGVAKNNPFDRLRTVSERQSREAQEKKQIHQVARPAAPPWRSANALVDELTR
jgi:hypothetical protein